MEAFEAAAGTLACEPEILLEAARQREQIVKPHWRRDWGTNRLIEGALAMVALRGLRRSGREVVWQYPCPGNPTWAADLAVGDGPGLVAKVKVRRPARDPDEDSLIWRDLLRLLLWCPGPCRLAALLVAFGEEGAPLQEQVGDLLSMRLGPDRHQYKGLMRLARSKFEEPADRDFLLDHFGGARVAAARSFEAGGSARSLVAMIEAVRKGELAT
jgi:hypothetical protein